MPQMSPLKLLLLLIFFLDYLPQSHILAHHPFNSKPIKQKSMHLTWKW